MPVALSGPLFSCHAPFPCPADERVQLERLRSELLGPDGQAGQIPSQALRVPLPLSLTDAEQQLLEAHRGKVEAWGWRWVPGAAGPLLSHAPLLWGTTLTATDLKVGSRAERGCRATPQPAAAQQSFPGLVHCIFACAACSPQLYLHLLNDTCGASGLPSGVVRVLNSKACRGAIMFGDELDQEQVGRCKQPHLRTFVRRLQQLECLTCRYSNSRADGQASFACPPLSNALQCQALLGRLSATQLCFSCAHGRPTTAPLVDLSLLRRALQLRAAAQLQGASGEVGTGGDDCGHVALSGLKAKLQQLVG